ncbi:metal-dependent transcriptional regulator [Haloferax sp. Atlit-6N]|uniref:SirR/DtxR family transcription regulator n=1 Tax=Haloferax gibbonsii TaxID=35746 RepID=A0A871BK89_HALGI|nr:MULTISPECIES: metal-dependent transcriptional regulator [Haloferax]QOS13468.1 SirR/DtxR family transcription regulator [Haloferax gibbonsii]REA00563.1 metal-dependent transcriptional regulator [Haloferax sp. Atlit-6N]
MSSDYPTGSATSHFPGLSEVERSNARYLFAISVLSTGSAERVTTGEIRKYLDVTPASVTEMLAKLDERGFVDYEKYRGVRLTDNGEELASRVAWRFCIVTSFFDSVLDTTLEDHTAFDIGFTLPEKGVYRLRERVNTPCLETCPESGRSGTACLV